MNTQNNYQQQNTLLRQWRQKLSFRKRFGRPKFYARSQTRGGIKSVSLYWKNWRGKQRPPVLFNNGKEVMV